MNTASWVNNCIGVFAQEAVGMEPFFSWFCRRAGLIGMAELLTGLVVFVGACLLMMRTNRSASILKYLILVQLPLLIGIIGTLTAVIIGNYDALKSLREGFLVTMPSYIVIVIGVFAHKLRSQKKLNS